MHAGTDEQGQAQEEAPEPSPKLGSRMQHIQLLLVKQGAKPALRMVISEEQLPGLSGFCRQQGLALVTSGRKVKVLGIPGKNEGYVDKGVAIPRDDPAPGRPIVFIAQDMNTAVALKAAEDLGNHDEMGRLLGYPSCCIRFFGEHLEDQREGDLSFLRPMMLASAKTTYPKTMNIFARHQDAAVLFHCPCSLDCAPSQRMAQQYLHIIEEQEPALAESIDAQLQGTVEQDGHSYRFV
ncbi:MAG: hypothetical protein GXP63_00160 [DPANN group archaeon]|nr:hypothetical protein [DPANN group archaeon]